MLLDGVHVNVGLLTTHLHSEFFYPIRVYIPRIFSNACIYLFTWQLEQDEPEHFRSHTYLTPAMIFGGKVAALRCV